MTLNDLPTRTDRNMLNIQLVKLLLAVTLKQSWQAECKQLSSFGLFSFEEQLVRQKMQTVARPVVGVR